MGRSRRPGAQHGDGLHRQACLDADEGPEAAVTPAELHVDEADRQRVEVGAAVADDPVAHDPQGAQLLHEGPRELGTLPVATGGRSDFGVAPRADPVAQLEFAVGQ